MKIVKIPGVVDAHVHFRDPGAERKEDFESGSKAAAAGGVTYVLDMPNNTPPVTTVEAFKEKDELVRGKSAVKDGLFFGATSENFEELLQLSREEMPSLCGIKVYMGESTGGLVTSDDTI